MNVDSGIERGVKRARDDYDQAENSNTDTTSKTEGAEETEKRTTDVEVIRNTLISNFIL